MVIPTIYFFGCAHIYAHCDQAMKEIIFNSQNRHNDSWHKSYAWFIFIKQTVLCIHCNHQFYATAKTIYVHWNFRASSALHCSSPFIRRLGRKRERERANCKTRWSRIVGVPTRYSKSGVGCTGVGFCHSCWSLAFLPRPIAIALSPHSLIPASTFTREYPHTALNCTPLHRTRALLRELFAQTFSANTSPRTEWRSQLCGWENSRWRIHFVLKLPSFSSPVAMMHCRCATASYYFPVPF